MGAFTVTVDDGIATAELNLVGEPINKITRDVGEELDQLIKELESYAGFDIPTENLPENIKAELTKAKAADFNPKYTWK